jgi:hypothetical protein
MMIMLHVLLLAASVPDACEPPRVCKCATPSIDQAYARSGAVFSGVVLTVGRVADSSAAVVQPSSGDEHGMPRISVSVGSAGAREVPVSLRVTRAWKGTAAGDTITVLDSEVCGVSFRPGEEFPVYAGGDGAPLYTSSCNRTRPLAPPADGVQPPWLPSSAEDVRVLDSIAAATRR